MLRRSQQGVAEATVIFDTHDLYPTKIVFRHIHKVIVAHRNLVVEFRLKLPVQRFLFSHQLLFPRSLHGPFPSRTHLPAYSRP